MFTMELNKNFDFIKTCRLCLNQNNELVSIFDLSIFEMQHSIIINKCTDVTISENDELPKKICLECVKCLNNFYQFRKLVVNSELCLIDFLNKSENNLNKNERVENAIYIKTEDLGMDFYEEPKVPTYPIKSEDSQYNFEQNSDEIVNKFEIVEEKLEIYDNKPPTSPVLSSLLSETTQDLEAENKNDVLINSHTNKEVCTSTSNLAKDKKLNTSEKPYICKQCGKGFSLMATLSRHEMIHTGVKPHSCQYCGKSFIQLSYLREHERIHTGEKPYLCKYCGKGFISSKNLKSHESIHTGEKSYNCEKCGKAFRTYSDLKQHKRTHTGEKPYTCRQCGKPFSKSYHLKRHEIIHTDVKVLYNCETCEKSFSNPYNLRRHQKSHESKDSK